MNTPPPVPASIEPTPPIVASGVSSDFIRGVAKVENRLIVMLDLDRIFTFEEKAALEKGMEVKAVEFVKAGAEVYRRV